MSPELQSLSRLSAARRRSVADAGGPTRALRLVRRRPAPLGCRGRVLPQSARELTAYVRPTRDRVFGRASRTMKNVWNGRPISLIVLAEPLDVLHGIPVSLIELIPPVHQRVYRMG